jgi:nitrite reductase (NADH) large subunit
MEGGLDYLKEVVIDDSHGICEDLERDMKELIAGYKCEWKEVVQNPALRSKFKHFVNTEDPDPTIEYVDMRGQKCPTDWNKDLKNGK